jgi:hypothetical protein
MPTAILTDTSNDLWVDSATISPENFGMEAPPHAWAIRKQTLRGGRRDGVDLITVETGGLTFSVIPTRGMGLWKGAYRGRDLGWTSPVKDGPINPSYVNLMSSGGIGWLDGFDELLVRCGLENNGSPYVETYADGRQSVTGVHGKIANIPAHYVAVHVENSPPHTITIEGQVDETRLFGPGIRMSTKITIVPGSKSLTVRDEFTNLKDQPVDMQVLYHWNFGPPYLEAGSRFVAPASVVVPRDARAVEGIGHYDVYGPPEAGFSEQVYFLDLHDRNGKTLAMLRDPAGENAVALRFSRAQLPYFTLWKCTGGVNVGYVTGLEPATNYPNAKPFEKERGRVVTLKPGASHMAEIGFEVLAGAHEVARIEQEIKALQEQGAPKIEKGPVEPFAAGA